MRGDFVYDEAEILNEMTIKHVSRSRAKNLIYMRAYGKEYHQKHREERLKYFKEYRRLCNHLKWKKKI